MRKSPLRWIVDMLTHADQERANEPVPADSQTRELADATPKYLYRYCSADRAIQILRDKTLYLCPPEKLNDVFEGAVGSAVRYDAALARELEVRRYMGLAGLDRPMAEEIVNESSS